MEKENEKKRSAQDFDDFKIRENLERYKSVVNDSMHVMVAFEEISKTYYPEKSKTKRIEEQVFYSQEMLKNVSNAIIEMNKVLKKFERDPDILKENVLNNELKIIGKIQQDLTRLKNMHVSEDLKWFFENNFNLNFEKKEIEERINDFNLTFNHLILCMEKIIKSIEKNKQRWLDEGYYNEFKIAFYDIHIIIRQLELEKENKYPYLFEKQSIIRDLIAQFS